MRLLKKSIQDEPALAKKAPVQEMIDCYVSLDRQSHLLTEAAKSSPELAIAMETWKEIKFEFETVDKLDVG